MENTMNTIYMDNSWRDVVDMLIYGDYQSRLMNGELSWSTDDNVSSRDKLISRLVGCKVPHKFVVQDENTVLIVGA
jgi:hypothetical protein